MQREIDEYRRQREQEKKEVYDELELLRRGKEELEKKMREQESDAVVIRNNKDDLRRRFACTVM